MILNKHFQETIVDHRRPRLRKTWSCLRCLACDEYCLRSFSASGAGQVSGHEFTRAVNALDLIGLQPLQMERVEYRRR